MRILYLTEFSVDGASAGLQRVFGISIALALAGHSVEIAGPGKASRLEGLSDNIHLHHVAPCSTSRSRLSRIISANSLRTWLHENGSRFDLLIVYSGPGQLGAVTKRWASRTGIPRILDSVEWYEPASLPGGRFGPRAINNEISMRFRYPRFPGVIAISRYLEEYYRNAGVRHVVRVPPTLDLSGRRQRPTRMAQELPGGPLRLVYAGDPGRKDSLGQLVMAVGEFDDTSAPVVLDVYGPTKQAARQLQQMPTRLPSNVAIHGRVSRAQVDAALDQAHLVPILRRERRYAQAGFPTKFVDAMASGTPVLANCTSDLRHYLEDGVTGFVASSNSVEHIASTLRRALEQRHLLPMMRSNCRDVAELHFDASLYASQLDGLVTSVVGGRS